MTSINRLEKTSISSLQNNPAQNFEPDYFCILYLKHEKLLHISNIQTKKDVIYIISSHIILD